ncbi:MAG: glycosyltransferase [Planctomycetes bacterium]|nr:glycosyltransferase [Planctomycetota bacterium]
MTRLLVVAYYFPPRGGAGTQRFAKFCKYLPEHGVEPVVLTSGNIEQNRNAPHDDPSLVTDALVAVERVDPPARMPLSQRLRRAMRLDLDEEAWAAIAEERALGLVQERAIDAVITTLSPFACYRIGERLRRATGMPWLLDLRDPWALDGWRSYRTRFHAAADLGHMRRALVGADYVIANVPEAAKAYVAMGADPARTVVIPNGHDEEDFDAPVSVPWAGDGRFHLVHMGTFHAVDTPEGLTRNGLSRVRHRQIEPLGRSGHYLLHALAQLRQRAPSLWSRLRVELYGNVDGSHRDLIERLGIDEVLSLHGYVPHRESIAALTNADAVFVPLHGVPAGDRALVVPGKLYEALASESPVLAALPEGDGADLVRALEAGLVVPPTDAAQLGAALEQLVAGWSRQQPVAGCPRQRLAPFSRRNLTKVLAAVVDAAVHGLETGGIADPWQSAQLARRS